MATKARELPSLIQHLGRYWRPPDSSRVTHSDVWRRLRTAGESSPMRTDPAERERLLRALLDAVDRMDDAVPDGSQADCDAWDDVWAARRSLRCMTCLRDDGTHSPFICR